jgi:hypothetical protein
MTLIIISSIIVIFLLITLIIDLFNGGYLSNKELMKYLLSATLTVIENKKRGGKLGLEIDIRKTGARIVRTSLNTNSCNLPIFSTFYIKGLGNVRRGSSSSRYIKKLLSGHRTVSVSDAKYQRIFGYIIPEKEVRDGTI